jgi:hypothetical protein
MTKLLPVWVAGLLCLSLSVQSQQLVSDFNSDVVTGYMEEVRSMIPATPGYTPPVASRAIGYIGLALYESVNDGIPGYESLSSVLEDMPAIPAAGETMHWNSVANSCLATIIDSLFSNAPEEAKASLHTLRDAWHNQFLQEVDAEVVANSSAYGVLVANMIFEYSQTDGGHEAQFSNFPSSYSPPSGPGLWVPLSNQAALQPYWGNLRKFAAANESEIMVPDNIPAYSSDENSLYYYFAEQVYTTSQNLTPEQINIAEWWADGAGTLTPPGHSLNLLRQVIEATNSNLEKTAVATAQLGLALSDAFSVCWKTKFEYNNERPVTYIQSFIDPSWTTLIGTPPFPDYISGHSTQSGAMATILTHHFGANYAFIDVTHETLFGGPREFDSFWEAAQEAAVSRLYGGIHWSYSNLDGLNCGAQVAEHVLDLFSTVSVGVTDSESIAEFTVYPNPAREQIRIQSSPSSSLSARIYSSTGQFVSATSNERVIDLSSLAQGMYIIEVHADGQFIGRKSFVKS